MHRSLQWYIDRAAHYVAIESTAIYLYDYEHGTERPWAHVKEIVDNGTIMNSLSIGCDFIAKHPCGLTFKWSIDVVKRDGLWSLDKTAINKIVNALPENMLSTFKVWLNRYATKIGEELVRCQSRMKGLREDFEFLTSL